MKIGSHCFQDSQLSSMIDSHKKYGDCDITGKKNCLIYDTCTDIYLEESLEGLLDIFTIDKNNCNKADYLKNFLSGWNIFNLEKLKDIQIIMESVCKNKFSEMPALFNEKIMIPELNNNKIIQEHSILKGNTWDEFSKNIKHVNRFHSNMVNFDILSKLLTNMTVVYPKGKLSLFRARICNGENYDKGYELNEMGVPPVDLASAGRTNSEGIQCLYLAENIETTLHEVRARAYDHVCIGTFEQQKELKIVDFNVFEKLSPFFLPDFDIIDFVINIEIIRKIGEEIAKPMRRFDKKIDYVPTQFICDFVKYLNFDGIKYKSTLSDSGINYALFDADNFKCTKVSMCKVKSIKFTYDL